MSKSKLESVKRLDIRYECRHENNTYILANFSGIYYSLAKSSLALLYY